MARSRRGRPPKLAAPDTPPSPERSATMRAVKSRDTGPELAVRRLLARSRPAIVCIAPTCRASPTSPTGGAGWRSSCTAASGTATIARAARGCRRPTPLLAGQDRPQSRPRRRPSRGARRAGLATLVIHECELKDLAALEARLATALAPLGAPLASRFRRLQRGFSHCTRRKSIRQPVKTTVRNFDNDDCRRAPASDDAPPKKPKRTRRCATTSACSGASSATRCASRKARRRTRSSSASGRPRSASIATTRPPRGASSPSSSRARPRADLRDPARLQLFLAPRQHRRGRAPHPPQSRPVVKRRRRARARSQYAFTRAKEAGVSRERLRKFFDSALVSPVLTAHPTEVRRKSTLTHELKVADLVAERGRLAGDEAALARKRGAVARAPCCCCGARTCCARTGCG